MPYSLAESPSGLVHLVHIFGKPPVRGKTVCGRDCDWDSWGRISVLDNKIWGKGPRTIRAMIELPTCDRCFMS